MEINTKPIINSVNKLVCCKPFQVLSVEKKATGLAFVGQQFNLTTLEVIIPTSWSADGVALSKGDKILVRGQQYTQPWAKAVINAEGVDGPFILVPESEICIVLYGDGE